MKFTKQKAINIVTCALVLSLSLAITPVFAESMTAGGSGEIHASSTTGHSIEQLREERHAMQAAGHENAQNIRTEARHQIQDVRHNASTTASTTRDEIRDIRNNERGQLHDNRQQMIHSFASSTAEMKTAIEKRRQELTDKFKAKKEERKIRLDAKAKEIVTERLTEIFKRLNNKIDIIQSVDAKLAARMNEAQGKGVNIASTTALYVIAQGSLAQAKTDTAAAQIAASAATNASSSKEVLIGLVKTAEDSVKDSAKAYKKVAISLHAVFPLASSSLSVEASGDVEASSSENR